MEALKVVKIGGNVIDDPMVLETFLQQFSLIQGPKILVHGGGKKATALCKQLGIEPKMKDGRRITDATSLEIVTMVYAGLLNKNIVALLQKHNTNALGLSGADANLIEAIKRPVKTIDYGFVGDVPDNAINNEVVQLLLKNGITPVLCALTHDKNGQLLNTNADTIATEVAKSMKKQYETYLIFCFEKNGVLANPEDENSVLSEIDWQQYQQYKKEQIITDGMIPKLDNAFQAISFGVKEVIIKHANNINNNFGTRLY